MDRRAFLDWSLSLALLGALSTARGQAPNPMVKFVEPPRELDAEAAALLAQAAAALDSGDVDVSTTLCDQAYMPLHPYEDFRMLIAAHAAPSRLTVCGASEPGARLRLVCAFADAKGNPIRDALIYVYHTNANGCYSDQAAHFSGPSGDEKHARLFGYVRTDNDGKIEVHTIRPAGYPDSDLPSHVHVEAFIGDRAVLISEVRFDDDPRLTSAQRQQSAREGFAIAEAQAQPDGSVLCETLFKLNVPRAR